MNHQVLAREMSAYSILYVEDDSRIRNYIGEFLSRYCKEIYSCESAEEGQILYDKHKPDIMIMDINLPGMSGIDFAELIRKNDKSTRIIITTAYTDAKFMTRAIELDLCRYLVKPVTSDDFFDALQKSLSALQKRDIIPLGDNKVYNKKLTALVDEDEVIPLRKKEVEILEFFIKNQGEVIRYDMLKTMVWNNGEVMSRDALRSQIRNIRKKIGNDCLQNIIDVGYMLKVSNDTQ